MRRSFPRGLTENQEAWLSCFSTMGELGKEAVQGLVGTPAGRSVLGTGGGGDATLELDRRAEEAILSALRALAPEPYGVVSEEEGVIAGPEGGVVVIIDPVDGSLNAKRGLPPHCAAFALGAGTTLNDVEIGFVTDYSRPGWSAAVRGAGFACSWTVPLEKTLETPEATKASAVDDGQIEMLLLEAGRPHLHTFAYRDLALLAGPKAGPEIRVRQIGSLALALCHLASGTGDVLFAPVPSRSVDIAGGLLMVAESGGGAASLDGSDFWAQPLDLQKRAPFVAWRRGIDAERLVREARSILP